MKFVRQTLVDANPLEVELYSIDESSSDHRGVVLSTVSNYCRCNALGNKLKIKSSCRVANLTLVCKVK